jgi:N-acetylglutamate synthase-like GNAT family acetyltransferase
MLEITKFDDAARKEIEGWDKYNHSDYGNEYVDMVDALDADSVKEYIDRVLQTQSKYPPEEVFSYVLKNEKNKIVAFSFFYLYARSDEKYDMFIQSIAVHPKCRRKGYGQELLGRIFANPEKYIGEKPVDVAGLVFPWNTTSLKFFNQFAEFEKRRYQRTFYLIISDYEAIENNIKHYKEDGLHI